LSSPIIERRFFANVVAAFVALSLAACGRQSKEEPSEREAEAPAEKARAADSPSSGAEPGVSAATAAGLEIVTADDLKRKVRASGRKGTLVNAWASFCGPCKREVPMLATIAENLRARGLDVVLVSLDEPADREKASAFLRERKIALESYVAERPLGPFKLGLNPRWRGMLPASFLFDADGTLRYFWGGEAFENEVVPVLEAFLAGKPLDGEANFPVAPESPPGN
jgi:thiol-disulfide isomerase/thioredoxin